MSTYFKLITLFFFAGVISEEKDVEVEEKLFELASAAANEEEPRGRSPCSILYLNRQEVQDKNVADCVEALLGVYVKVIMISKMLV